MLGVVALPVPEVVPEVPPARLARRVGHATDRRLDPIGVGPHTRFVGFEGDRRSFGVVPGPAGTGTLRANSVSL